MIATTSITVFDSHAKVAMLSRYQRLLVDASADCLLSLHELRIQLLCADTCLLDNILTA